MNEENQQPTKFNMAISTLMRLDTLLKGCAEAATRGDLFGWNENLLTLRRNVFPFIKQDEIKEIESLFEKLNSERWVYFPEGKKRILPKQIDRIWRILDKIEIVMQLAMKDAGLLMPKGDDPRFALEG